MATGGGKTADFLHSVGTAHGAPLRHAGEKDHSTKGYRSC